jgi:L-alanine-DL-glutamate epimerase-like enolase superfamily enzyme
LNLILTEIKKLELKNVWTLSRNSSYFKENVFLEIEKDGITGYGEAAPNVRYGETAQLTEKIIKEAAGVIVKQDLFKYRQIKKIIDELIVGQNCAKAAIDMAVMDWVAKAMDVPLYKMMGLDGEKEPVTCYTIGIASISEIKNKTRDAAEYPILKIKLGVENDEEIINAVREVTDKPLRVDANEGWGDKETAVKKIQWLEKKGVEFIEQPMPAEMLEETGWLRERVALPLIADEAVINSESIAGLSEVYDGINIKLMKAGGIQEAVKMIYIAEALKMDVMLGCMVESSLAISAAAQLSSLVKWLDLDTNLLINNDPFCGVKTRKGKMSLNSKPGLGVSKRV